MCSCSKVGKIVNEENFGHVSNHSKEFLDSENVENNFIPSKSSSEFQRSENTNLLEVTEKMVSDEDGEKKTTKI